MAIVVCCEDVVGLALLLAISGVVAPLTGRDRLAILAALAAVAILAVALMQRVCWWSFSIFPSTLLEGGS